MRTALLGWLLIAFAALGCHRESPDAGPADRAATAPSARTRPEKPDAPPPTTAATGPRENATRPATRPTTRPKPATAPATATAPAAADALERGLARVRALERRTRFGQAIRAARDLRSRFGRRARRAGLARIVARLREAQRLAPQLRYALERMADRHGRGAEVAGRELVRAGRTGRLFLRHGVRTLDPDRAAAAARLLIETGDPRAAPVFAERLADAESDALRDVLLEGLRQFPARVPADAAAALHDALRASAGLERLGAAKVLWAIYQRVCDRDAARFNARIERDGAAAFLEAYAERASRAAERAARRWAFHVADQYVRGIRGRYYHGTDFGERVAERIEERVAFRGSEFPFPEGRSDRISARWEGYLRIDEAGRYTFFSTSDDGQRLSVAGERIIDDWTRHAMTTRKASLELEKGLHRIEAAWFERGGGEGMILEWSGPGFERRVIGPESLRAIPIGGDAAGDG